MIRELVADDAPAVVRLAAAAYPQWVQSERGFLHRIANTPARARRRRWVAADEGGVTGYASSGIEIGFGDDDVGEIGVLVEQGARGRGTGSALFAVAERHVGALGVRRILAEGRDDDASRRFAVRCGFRHTMTRRLSRLDPRSVPKDAHLELLASRADVGYRVVAMATVDREAVFELDAACSRDVPLDEQLELDRDEWNVNHWRNPDVAQEGSFVVLHGDRPVSFAMLRVAGTRGANDMTGTLREHRGRGLARLAKMSSLLWAAEHGVTEVVTENDETNAPMLALNTSLGYRPFASVLAYVRDLA